MTGEENVRNPYSVDGRALAPPVYTVVDTAQAVQGWGFAGRRFLQRIASIPTDHALGGEKTEPVGYSKQTDSTRETECSGTAPLRRPRLAKVLPLPAIPVPLEAGRRRAVLRKAIRAVHRTVASRQEGYLVVLAALGTLDLVHLTDASVTHTTA